MTRKFERWVIPTAALLLVGCFERSASGNDLANAGASAAGIGGGDGGVSGGGSGGVSAAGSGGVSAAGSGGVSAGGNGGAGGTTSDDAADATDTPYCPGWETRSSAASCLSTADCVAGQSCIFDFTPLQCPPTGAACLMGCNDDAFCGPGNLCHHPYFDDNGPCGCGTSGGTCGPSCTDAAMTCQAGYMCDVDGRCVPESCDAGYACGAGRTCDAAALDADDHGCRVLRCHEAGFGACSENLDCDPGATSGTGCIRRSCTSASDCDCGACAPNGTGRTCAFAVGYCGDPNPWF